MPENEAIAIRDHIVNEIQGMKEMPDPLDSLMLATIWMNWR